MNTKQLISILLILLGAAGLIIGSFGIFGSPLTPQNPWIYAILGLIFFTSGISLLKSSSN